MPGIFSFQATFFVSLHSAGRPFSLEMPSFFGPRHCGQFSARGEPVNAIRRRRARRVRRTWITAGNSAAKVEGKSGPRPGQDHRYRRFYRAGTFKASPL
jgi:hypothetical protein